MTDGKVLKRGWLKKQGGLVRNWQDRWFVLRGTSLLYFTRDDEGRQQGHIDLSGSTVAEVPYNRDEPEKWLFEITQSARGGKSVDHYVLWAPNEHNRTEWVSSVRRSIYHYTGGGVFGGPLLHVIRYDKTHYDTDVPHLVHQCVERIRADGMQVEGIFRLSGRVAQVKEMRKRYDEGKRPDFAQECVDIHTAASLLKLYFRELPEPIIPFEHFEAFLNLATSFRYNSNHDKTFKSLKSLVRQIPEENYKLLNYITGFLYEISQYQQVNKMTEKNIATIFGTNILRSEDDSPEFQMATQNLTTQVVLALVTWHSKVFSDEPPEVGDDITVDQKEMEQLVNISDNADLSSISDTDSLNVSMGEPANAVGDLLGIDFNSYPVESTKSAPSGVSVRPAPPPIPARAGEQPDHDSDVSMRVTSKRPNQLGDLSVAHMNSNGDMASPDSEHFVSAPETPVLSSPDRPVPTPRVTVKTDKTNLKIEQNPQASIRRHAGGSLRARGRPCAVVSERSPSPPPAQRRSGTLPMTKVERAESNFTSFIDSPLDTRVSLNIGDLPSTVEDLQALALSLKLQLKEKNKVISHLEHQVTSQTVKHQQQVAALAQKIYQERESRDHAVSKVVTLSNQLAEYQSQFGHLK